MQNLNQMKNNRNHKRFNAQEETYAYTPQYVGRVLDVSRGGIALTCIDIDKPETPQLKEFVVDILTNEKTIFAKDIPAKIAWVKPQISPFSDTKLKRVGLEFGELTDQKKALVYELILNCAGPA